MKARAKILEVLFDGKWHQIKDLKVYTKVSPRTLYKHLNALEAFIETKEDVTTHPHQVYHRASPPLLSLMVESELIKATTEGIMADLLNSKDLAPILKVINMLTNMQILLVLETIKKSNLDISEVERISFLMRSFVLTHFEYLMAGLVRATTKIINDVDFDQVRKDLQKV